MNTPMRNDKSQYEDFGESITGVHSAIKQFVEAQKENPTSKKAILKKAINGKG